MIDIYSPLTIRGFSDNFEIITLFLSISSYFSNRTKFWNYDIILLLSPTHTHTHQKTNSPLTFSAALQGNEIKSISFSFHFLDLFPFNFWCQTLYITPLASQNILHPSLKIYIITMLLIYFTNHLQNKELSFWSSLEWNTTINIK